MPFRQAEKIRKENVVKFYINGFFLWVIGIVCTFMLLVNLSGLPNPY